MALSFMARDVADSLVIRARTDAGPVIDMSPARRHSGMAASATPWPSRPGRAMFRRS
jgi:hypothetical protein